MQQETVCVLRRTNIFLRLVLFLFTLLIVGAAAALVAPRAASLRTLVLFVLAAVAYAGAEYAVAEYHIYRGGIEEALAVCSVGFLCVAISASTDADFLVPLAGAVASLWLWHRFGLAYAFLAAMLFVCWLPSHWTQSSSARHLIVAGIYAAGLLLLAALPKREESSLAEAFLWGGLYLAINLYVLPTSVLGVRNQPEPPGTFYWFTWVLTWLIPVAILGRGIHRKNRFVMAAGSIAAVITLITNKSYLHWQRHTWDAMLLGALLLAIAFVLQRWLAAAPGGIRHGFTARRLSSKDKHWIDAGSFAFGLAVPSAIPQPDVPQSQFGGGESGGGGASSDF